MGLLKLFKKPKKDVEGLIVALGDKDRSVRKDAATALGRIGDPRAVEPLITALEDEFHLVRENAAMALGRIGDERAVEPLISALGDKDSSVRHFASYALGTIGDPKAVPALEKAANDSNRAKKALDNIKSSDAYEKYLKEEALRLEKSHKEASTYVSSIESEIAELKSSGVKIQKAEELLKQAKSKLNKSNFKQANDLAKEAKKVANERKSGHDLAVRSISESESVLNETKNKNVIIPSDLLTKSKQEFKSGDYERAKKSAEELKNLVSTKETKYREAQEEIKSAESSIEKAEEFGCCDVSEAEERLKNAEQLFMKGAYEKVIEAAKRTGELAKKIKEESKPDVTISLSQTSFKPDEWKRIDLAIKNIGTATAKAINVEYPKERVEIDDLIEVKELKPDEETKLRIVFRPIHTGEVPLKTKITYKDFDNKEYKEGMCLAPPHNHPSHGSPRSI